MFVAKNDIFLEKERIFEKGIGKRAVQLEELREPE
jgi:hypothetical protein